MENQQIQYIVDPYKPESTVRFDASERFQYKVFDSVMQALTENINEAQRYAKKLSNIAAHYVDQNTPQDIEIDRVHNTLFIDGDRGTGKTAFIQNLKAMIDAESNSLASKIHILPSIDPTLLVEDEHFINVIIARIHRSVENRMMSGCSFNEAAEERYNKVLKKLTDSLTSSAKSESRKHYTGLDRILNYDQGNQLEQNWHLYLGECTTILGCNAFVVLLDDVDMALDKAYDLLETIRRYLSCPLVIPIVTGFIPLYLDEVERSFNKQQVEGVTAKRLAREYLIKVFPEHQRFYLSTIADLFNQIHVKLKVGAQQKQIKLTSVDKVIGNFAYPMINGEEDSRPTFILNKLNARRLVQGIKLFLPFLEMIFAIDRQDKLLPIDIEEQSIHQLFWQKWQLYSNINNWRFDEALAALESKRLDSPALRFSQELLFNAAKQNKEVATKEQYDFQAVNLEWLDTALNSENLGRSRRGGEKYLLSEQRLLERQKNIVEARPMYTLDKFPAIDFLIGEGKGASSTSISQRKIKIMLNNAEVDTNASAMLIGLFTSNEFYLLEGYSYRFLVWGKFFELLFDPLWLDSDSIKDKAVLQDRYTKMLFSRAFHSYPAIFPTKGLDTYSGEDDDTKSIESASGEAIQQPLEAAIKAYVELLSNDPKYTNKLMQLSKYRKAGVSRLIHLVFNKVFTQLGVIRRSRLLQRTDVSSSTLFHLAQRFKMITLNAIASFIKTDGVVLLNVANGTNVGDDASFKSSGAYSNNVKPILESDDKSHPYFELLNFFDKHPLFEFIGLKEHLDKLNSREHIPIDFRVFNGVPNDSGMFVEQFFSEFSRDDKVFAEKLDKGFKALAQSTEVISYNDIEPWLFDTVQNIWVKNKLQIKALIEYYFLVDKLRKAIDPDKETSPKWHGRQLNRLLNEIEKEQSKK